MLQNEPLIKIDSEDAAEEFSDKAVNNSVNLISNSFLIPESNHLDNQDKHIEAQNTIQPKV